MSEYRNAAIDKQLRSSRHGVRHSWGMNLRNGGTKPAWNTDYGNKRK